MADLLTLAEARTALRMGAGNVTDDADLTTYYIPAVTPVVEDLTGPIIAAAGLTWTVDGGVDQIALPSAVTAVTAVTENGVVLAAGSEYVVNLRAGIVMRGTQLYPFTFLPGNQNITVTYNVGSGVIPPNVKLAARKILRALWLDDQQGEMPAYAQPDVEMVQTPSGYAIPKDAFLLLQATQDVPGFA